MEAAGSGEHVSVFNEEIFVCVVAREDDLCRFGEKHEL